MSTTNIIKQIRNIMREDSGLDGDAQRIPQLVWMIFLKVWDDKETEQGMQARLNGATYTPTIDTRHQWRSWAGDSEGLTGDNLLNYINNELFPYLKSLDASVSVQTGIVKEVFEDAINFSKSGTLTRQIINIINDNFDFNKSQDRHILNDVYENILSNLSSSKATGEFYTPKPLTNFIVQMVNPRLGEIVLDPACGTGGFLVNTIEHLREQNPSSEDVATFGQNLRGKEIKQMAHLLCMTNMILHGVDNPVGITRDSSLSQPIKDIKLAEKVDVIVANPPFGGVVKQGEEKNFPPALRSRETADLFLILIMNLLKSNGRAGLVLPDGILFGGGSQAKLKKELLETCNVHTIVKIPSGAFIYTPISTNLIFFEKGKPTKEIWYYQIQPPQGSKSYGKTKPISDKYFEDCKTWWADRKETEQAWKVDIQTIIDRNYNLDFKNPFVVEGEKELSYNEIIQKIKENLNTSQSILN